MGKPEPPRVSEHIKDLLEGYAPEAAIRYKVIEQRSKGHSVDKACRIVGKARDLEPEQVKKIYFDRGTI